MHRQHPENPDFMGFFGKHPDPQGFAVDCHGSVLNPQKKLPKLFVTAALFFCEGIDF
ncbi:hypothetical protein [Paraburkholderia bannensis]|uniref:hypothetical protein n=1 Tax=Paraburkholderia bannensis TaxID=765414 RepID=UPI002AB79FC1|nr:hypothetical protein [Paraburkholderia bannensis]